MNRHAYIGRTTKPEKNWPDVGTVVCVCADEPQARPDKEVAKWIREGLTIERVPVQWVREHFGTTAASPLVKSLDRIGIHACRTHADHAVALAEIADMAREALKDG